MNSTTQDAIPCLECGATNMPRARRCWLCSRPIEPLVEAKLATERAEDPDDPLTAYRAPGADLGPSQTFLSSTLLILTAVTVLVGVGIALNDAGPAVTYAIVMAPALLATYVASARRESRGKPLSPGGKVVAFLLSIAAVIGLLMLLVVAALVALFVFCLISMR